MQTKIKVLIIITLSTFLAACNQSSQERDRERSKTEVSQELQSEFSSELQLQVYYFHTTNRCMACNAIENTTREVVESAFSNEIENGTVAFSAINVDENRELAKKYQTAGVSLKMVAPKSEEDYVIDMTRFAFAHVRSHPEEFSQAIQDSVRTIIARYN